MSEPDISTLARRLAEQNNVDWRALGGSGPEGKVVERDVLDYLARVMAGEEATNPTPEPLPSGMDVWPDQDLDNFRSGVNAEAAEASGSLGDLRDELGRSVRPEDDAGASASAEPATDDVFGGVETVPFGASERQGSDHGATMQSPSPDDTSNDTSDETSGVDEDIFLFDDDDDDGDASAAVGGADAAAWDAEPVSGAEEGADARAEVAGASGSFADAATESTSLSANDDLDDLLVAGEELAGDDDGSDAASATDFATGFGNDLATEPERASTSGLAASEFGELSTAGFEERDDGLGLGEESDPDFGSASFAGTDKGADHGEDTWGSNISLGDDSDSFGSGASTAADADATDLWGEPEKESAGDDDLWTAGTAEAAVADDSVLADESPWGSSEATSPTSDLQQEAANPWSSGVTGEEALSGDEQVTGATITGSDEVGNASTAGGGEAPDVGTAMAGNLPLTRSATILRRHIDLSALASSQVSVGNELGFDEPLGVGPFLLRAVAKAAGALDVPVEHVALAVLGDGLRLRRISDAAQRSFSSLVSELAAEVIEEDEPRLVAADLSVLDLDEALLDLDVPVVTLGRILYDNQRGAYRSTLTLTGAVHPDAGAKLLARVAELLDAPVRLVL